MTFIASRTAFAGAVAVLVAIVGASPAGAVVTNVQVTAGTVPQTSSNISLFAQPPGPGVSPIATGRTDSSGVVRFDVDQQYTSDDNRRRCLILVVRDEQGRETGRVPCFYIPPGGGNLVANTQTGQVTAGRPGDATFLRQDQLGDAQGPFNFGLAYGYTFGSTDTKLTRDNVSRDGAAIDVSTPSLLADVRWSPPELRMGNLGPFGPSDCFVGVQGAVGLDNGDTGLNSDEHGNDGQIDTTINREFRGSVTPLVGCTFAKFPNGGGRINLQAGPRISFSRLTFTTDERPGGGVLERVEKSETNVGGIVGLEYNLGFSEIGLGRLGNVGNMGRSRAGLRAGILGEYLPGSDVSLTSSTFGFNYRSETESSWLWTFVVGGYLNF